MQKKIVFIGNFQLGPGGEPADETHLVRELEEQGNEVYKIPRDEWREYVIEKQPQNKYKVPENVKADIVIICKWHHFFDGQFVEAAREKYQAPVFYWVWDYMEGNSVEDWHMKMAKAADLYLSGEIGLAHYYHSNGIKFYYFQYDVCDIKYLPMMSKEKLYDVVYLGSHTNQNGRLDLLKEINKVIPIQVFAYDFEEWRKDGFQAAPGVYEQEFNMTVAKSKIVLGTSAGPRCFGYWSNRVGKVLHTGGFLLQQYTPGMELFLADCVAYFSTAEEAIEKIKHYLAHPEEIEVMWEKNTFLGKDRWTSEYKIRQLLVLVDRFLKDPRRSEWMLP